MLRSRYRRIVWFFAGILLTLLFWDWILPRLGGRGLARRTRPNRFRRIAARYRSLANELGGVMIKVGQFLSSRVDVLPDEITAELAQLQDEVRAESFDDIRHIIEAELGGALGTIFDSFEARPLAAASLGQVHRAHLREPGNGIRDIVVKVQRPNIEMIIATDLAALRTVLRWVKLFPPVRKRANLDALLAEFTRILDGELDYLAEGRNAETFAENFADDEDIRVPHVIWPHTTKRVLALQDVFGIKITDYAAIERAHVDRAEVAERVFHVYLKQIFNDGFFHADPHPGNLFVTPLKDGDWVLTFVDFGMVGHVTPNVRAGMRELAIGIGMRDLARMHKGYELLGALLPNADLRDLERFENEVFDRFWGKSMRELRNIQYQEMQQLMREYRGVVLSLPFQVPEDLILLGRTVAILSGICTGLNPDFNFWNGIAPFAQRILAEENGSNWELIINGLTTMGRTLWSLPIRLDNVLGIMERGQIQVLTPQLDLLIDRMELSVRRLVGGVIFAGMLFSGVQLYLAHEIIFAWVLIAGAGLAFVWLLTTRRI